MIELNAIRKTFGKKGSEFEAIVDVSLKIESGEFVSIIGRSGCGKTTLLNILGCIDKPTSGDYFLNSVNVIALSNAQRARLRRKQIGFVFQAYNLLTELNIEDNVSLTMGYDGVSRKERIRYAQDLLERVGLRDKAKHYPSQLSGGEQQRVAIARAISCNPALLLADEPTGNLDYSTGLAVMDILRQLNKRGTTIVMVTHDEEFAQYATRIVRMSDGHIAI